MSAPYLRQCPHCGMQNFAISEVCGRCEQRLDVPARKVPPPLPSMIPDATQTKPTPNGPLPIAYPAATWRQLLSMAVDGALVLSIFLPLVYAVYQEMVPPRFGVLLFASVFVAVTYLSSRGRGQTLGRFICRSTLVRLNGRPIAGWQRIVRSIAALLSLALGGLGYFWCIYDRRSRSLHDILSGTVVVGRHIA